MQFEETPATEQELAAPVPSGDVEAGQETAGDNGEAKPVEEWDWESFLNDRLMPPPMGEYEEREAFPFESLNAEKTRINAKAALLTRGLAEITRLGLAFNANPLTFAGLSGMGDLIVTAFSEHSRNHTLGVAVGRGETTDTALSGLSGVAEGAITVRSARALAGSQRVEMPITEEVYRMLHEGASPRDSMARLLRRSPRQEIWK